MQICPLYAGCRTGIVLAERLSGPGSSSGLSRAAVIVASQNWRFASRLFQWRLLKGEVNDLDLSKLRFPTQAPPGPSKGLLSDSNVT